MLARECDEKNRLNSEIISHTRHHYVIKTNDNWNEDKAGIQFTNFIIIPFLNSIGSLINTYRVNKLETINMRKNTLEENFNNIE